MLSFVEKSLEVNINEEVTYANLCSLRPVFYVEFREEGRVEEIGRRLREGVPWEALEGGRLYGFCVNGGRKEVKSLI